MDRSEALDTAKKYVTKDKADEHGSLETTFGLISRLWSEYLDYGISETDVAMLMSLLKIARQRSNATNQDNYVDLAGYAALGAELSVPRLSDNDSTQEIPHITGDWEVTDTSDFR